MMPWRNGMYVLLLFGILALQSGCGDTAPERRDGYGARSPEATKGIGPLGLRSQNGTARVGSEQLTRIAEQVPGVEGAIVALNGDTVVVGLSVDDSGKRRIVEKQVMSQLLWQYPEYDYYVTSDESLVERVRSANRNGGQYGMQSIAMNDEISAIADEIARTMIKPQHIKR
ncbi:YhcN/YlaJ family sporulation lipoprotein [Paenibacillus agaridevorans]|uniref:YhcN/YlaJ family sporulation lipoprotein n=1 Tax=Paenibacillus agaridevorans TaxID=171404 RepID=UPI001BE4DF02|nr:YhcN/YlaJ family sporulation lipoprotein [Paenibacillus agaridevorans]